MEKLPSIWLTTTNELMVCDMLDLWSVGSSSLSVCEARKRRVRSPKGFLFQVIGRGGPIRNNQIEKDFS